MGLPDKAARLAAATREQMEAVREQLDEAHGRREASAAEPEPEPEPADAPGPALPAEPPVAASTAFAAPGESDGAAPLAP